MAVPTPKAAFSPCPVHIVADMPLAASLVQRESLVVKPTNFPFQT